MAQPPQTPRGDDDPEMADAAFLFQDEAPRRPSGAPPPAHQTPSGSGGGDYDLAGDEPEEDAAPVPPVPLPQPAPRRPKPEAERRETAKPARTARVDEVWSRGAEWGSTLVLLGIVLLVIGGLLYLNLSAEKIGLLAVILLVGGAVLLILSYPIVITLERPVRMTPEQAVSDFYTALAHHIPHYRRMWLLLSSEGRASSSFHTFEKFKAYWKLRLTQLRKGKGGSFTPLLFEIHSFKSEKSGGQTEVDGSYTIDVYLRGKKDEGTLESVLVKTDFVRGPDRMWYLNDGTLPEGKAEPSTAAQRSSPG